MRRATLADAKQEAGLILTKPAQGEADVLALTFTDRLIYLHACETLVKVKVPLDVAVSDYVYSLGLVHGVGTLTDAIRLSAKQHAGFQSRVSVSEAVEELLRTGRSEGFIPVHVDDLECRLGARL